MLKARCAAAVLLLLVAPAAIAEVLHDTFPDDLPGNPNRIIGILVSFPQSRSDQWADPFQVPIDGDYLLDRLTLRLTVKAVEGRVGDMEVRLLDDGNNAPGVVLESWRVPWAPILDRPTEVALAGESTLLEAGHTYWVAVAMASNQTQGLWGKAELTSSVEWRWAMTRVAEPIWLLPPSVQPLGLLRVEATPVPEPSATALALAGLAAASALAGRRRSSPAPRRCLPKS
jgi:hypothetical protein